MPVKANQPVAASPDAYVVAVTGWQRPVVDALRSHVLAASHVDEAIKWTNIVFFSSGPLVMIRTEGRRVLFGFWRGQRLRPIEPQLKPDDKYEMATMTFR